MLARDIVYGPEAIDGGVWPMNSIIAISSGPLQLTEVVTKIPDVFGVKVADERNAIVYNSSSRVYIRLNHGDVLSGDFDCLELEAFEGFYKEFAIHAFEYNDISFVLELLPRLMDLNWKVYNDMYSDCENVMLDAAQFIQQADRFLYRLQ